MTPGYLLFSKGWNNNLQMYIFRGRLHRPAAKFRIPSRMTHGVAVSTVVSCSPFWECVGEMMWVFFISPCFVCRKTATEWFQSKIQNAFWHLKMDSGWLIRMFFFYKSCRSFETRRIHGWYIYLLESVWAQSIPSPAFPFYLRYSAFHIPSDSCSMPCQSGIVISHKRLPPFLSTLFLSFIEQACPFHLEILVYPQGPTRSLDEKDQQVHLPSIG